MSRRRVIQIVNSLSPPGGAETVAVNLATRASEKWEPHVLCLRSGDATGDTTLVEPLRRAGVPVHEIPMRGLRDLRNGRSFLRLLRRLRPAVVHAHNRPSDFWAMAYAAWARVPARVYSRQITYVDLSPSMQRRYRVAAQLAHRVIGVSVAVKGHLVHEERCPPPRITTIPNGVDLERFDPASAANGQGAESLRAAWRVPRESPLVGVVCRLTHQKGLDIFLRVAAGVLAEAPEARFVIVGAGAEKDALERQAAGLGLSHACIFPGFCDPASALAAFDLFLSTSRYEGLPLALLEAMAAGLPVVAPRVGAFPEVVEHGVSGLLPAPRFWAPSVQTLDPVPFIEAVLSLIEDPRLGTRLGEEARKRVEEGFSIAGMVERHEALYESLLGREGRA